MSNKKKPARYAGDQTRRSLKLCEGKHQYGPLILAGSKSIAAKECLVCSHVLYKHQVVEARNKLREELKKINNKQIDLFHF